MAQAQNAKAQRITPRAKDFSEWYGDVITQAQLADYSPVRGCMVIRPHGYRMWELMQRALDDMIKASGHKNAYFPLFIPMSYLAKEAEHVEGFAKEVAIVTHTRLRATGKEGKDAVTVDPTSALEEPLVVRPTSETIIYGMLAKWIQSYRDLPVLLNQWCNIVRWEMRTRLFLRTTEFLWQEGHTSQFLGQNFAKAFGVQFQTAAGGLDHVWSTSWGVSTRLIGGLIMTHSDDNGLVAPPKVAPVQVAIVPIWKTDDERAQVSGVGSQVKADLEKAGLRVELDLRDTMKPGAKYFEWEGLGVPVRLEIGPRDLASGQVVLARRTGGKAPVPLQGVTAAVTRALDEIQASLLAAALERREKNSIRGATKAQFLEFIKGTGGFAYGGFCGQGSCEAEIKAETNATIRVLPDPEFRSKEAPQTCMWCDAPSVAEAVWALAY